MANTVQWLSQSGNSNFALSILSLVEFYLLGIVNNYILQVDKTLYNYIYLFSPFASVEIEKVKN